MIIWLRKELVIVAQLVRASDCGSEGREFDSPQSPNRILLHTVTI